MEPKLIVLHFVKNTRNGESKVVAHLVQEPPSNGMVVFPGREYADQMTEPGWYMVELRFPPGGKAAIAKPVNGIKLIEASSDLQACFLEN